MITYIFETIVILGDILNRTDLARLQPRITTLAHSQVCLALQIILQVEPVFPDQLLLMSDGEVGLVNYRRLPCLQCILLLYVENCSKLYKY